MRRRTLTVSVATAVAALLFGPAAFAAPPEQAVLGPQKSPQAVIQDVDCDDDGIAETTVAVMVPRAGFGSAAFGRPGVGHVVDSDIFATGDKQVGQGIRVVLDPEIGDPILLEDRFWGHGNHTFECSFEIVEEGVGTFHITVFGMALSPQGPSG